MATMAVGSMGRKKKLNAAEGEGTPAVYGMRMSRAFLAWLDELAGHERCGKADVVDRALAAYAESIGFKRPPKR